MAITITIPGRERPEWGKIISGEIQHNYKNYVLQTKIFQLQKSVENKSIEHSMAVDELYKLCAKYALAVQIDCKQIFKSW